MSYYPLRKDPKHTHEDMSKKYNSAATHSLSKKMRFDYRNPSTLAPDVIEEEDPILELDEIGKKGRQQKRNAIQLDGYDSDSSGGNFDERAETKAQASRKTTGEEIDSQSQQASDMFAELNEESAGSDEDQHSERKGKKRTKEVRFLDANEIEGQVITSKSGGHVSADFSLHKRKSGDGDHATESSDDSADDCTRAKLDEKIDKELGAGAKKHKAPKLDAFNMKTEAEEGKFDDTGNFVRKAADPYAVHDSWLEGSSKADMKRAKEAHTRREEEQRRRDAVEDAVSTASVLSTLISHLEDGETVLEAIARLGRSTGRKTPKWQRNKRSDSLNVKILSSWEHVVAKDVENKTIVEAITEAADKLLTRGQSDIYDAERALLMRQYRRESGGEWQEEKSSKACVSSLAQWEYRWTDGRAGGEVFGPYDAKTIQSWIQSGYFADGVELKEAATNGQWISALNFS